MTIVYKQHHGEGVPRVSRPQSNSSPTDQSNHNHGEFPKPVKNHSYLYILLSDNFVSGVYNKLTELREALRENDLAAYNNLQEAIKYDLFLAFCLLLPPPPSCLKKSK